MNRSEALESAIRIAIEASAIVMRVYKEDFAVEYKGKSDPVTLADREANAYITRALGELFPGVPVVAEESEPSSYAAYETAPRAWFVDPLDGTREFVAKNGQFAVMIGLAEAGRPTLGAIVWPVEGRVFAGGEGFGAFEMTGSARPAIRVSGQTDVSRAGIVISRSHPSPETAAALARIGGARVTPTGSAGRKGTLIACGEADIYVHPGRAGKLWDTCAPEAIVLAAGGEVTDANGNRIDYRRGELSQVSGLLMSNGALHAHVLRSLEG